MSLLELRLPALAPLVCLPGCMRWLPARMLHLSDWIAALNL